MSEQWPTFKSTDAAAAALRALSDELDREFAVEQALLPSGVVERVAHELPLEATPLLRFARALTGAVVLAAFGCIALAALLAGRGLCQPVAVLRLVSGMGAVVMAVLLNFAAPRLVLWDAQLFRRLTGRFSLPGAVDLVLVRAGALVILFAGGIVLLP